MISRLALAALAAAVLLLRPGPASADDSAGYKLVKTIDLPGVGGAAGGEIALDDDTGAVWVAQSPSHNVVVIETHANTVRQVIEGIDGASGIAFSEHFAFVSDAVNNVTVVLGKRSYERATELRPSGAAPAATYFDPKRGALWVTAGDEMTVFKAVGRGGFKRLAGLRLKPAGKAPPGIGLYVASKDRIYQPAEDFVDVINPNSRRVEHVWRSGGRGRVTSVAHDARTDRLVLGTDGKEVAIIDARTGKTVAQIQLGGGVNDVTVDAGLRRGFAADSSGSIAVIDLDRNALIGTVPTDRDVRSIVADPVSHVVYVYRDRSNKVDLLAPR